jgi:beta-phosphoglucomutase
MKNITSVFFDFDGVVIDSEPVHAKAKRLVLEKHRISYPDTIFDDYKGRPDDVFFAFVSENLSSERYSSETLYASKKDIFETIITELKLVDGFQKFLQKVKNKRLRTAMVSSTSVYSLNLVDSVFNITDMFDLIITEVDTDKHKPYPDPYLKALEKLPADVLNTIVIEDSPNGIISAKRAGCFVYGLTSSFSADKLREAGADIIVDSYDELSAILKFD